MEHIEVKIRGKFSTFTKKEKKIAEYMLDNIHNLPFETASSIARQVKTTSMTVGRFLRNLDYKGMEAIHLELKNGQNEASKSVADRFRSLEERPEDHHLPYAQCMQAEMDALTKLYEKIATPVWLEIVKKISNADFIYVVGFATLEDVAAVLTTRLKYMRSNVSHVTSRDGMFLDIFDKPEENTCLIVFDDRRYERTTKRLLSLAKKNEITIVFITDEHCYWGQEYTNLLLPIPTKMPVFWPSLAAFGSVITLLVNAVMQQNTKRMSGRMKQIEHLQDHFDFFEE